MIDTDKYEGHTLDNLEIDADLPTWGVYDRNGWGVYDRNGNVVADYNPTDDAGINEANARLIADASLLLEEVKRLHDGIRLILSEETAYDLEVFERKLMELIE